MFRLPTLFYMALQTVLTNYFSQLGDDRPLYRPLKPSYDYIIVGGGTSGSVLATRLSEEPDSVLLIEAGRSDLANDNIPIPAYHVNTQLSKDDWNYFSVAQTRTGLAMKGRREYWPRGKVLGGCSSTGAHSHHRGARFDYDEWASQGADGWSFRDVLPYFLKSEDMRVPGLSQSVFHSTGGPLTISPGFSTPIQDYFQRAAEDLQFPIIDCNGADAIGFCPAQSNIKDGERCSSVSCFLRRYLKRKNLQVTINTLVSKILIRDNRAIGVEVIKKGRRLQIFANKEVILSAGVINTPQILMLSGIGPAQHLRRFGIPVIADLPVGNNLQDQVTIPLHYTIDQNITITSKTLRNAANIAQWLVSKQGILSKSGMDGTLFVKTAPAVTTPPDYPDIWIVSFSYASDKAMVTHGLKYNYRPDVIDNQVRNADISGFNLFPLIVRPESTGTVRLSTTDPRRPPIIRPNHFASINDVNTLIRGIRVIQELVATRSFSALNPRLLRRDFGTICNQYAFDTNEYWFCMVRHFSQHTYHACCTSRMGAETDPTAVVDPELRVKGVQNLRIVDASVMRNQIAGDPHAPAIMIAEKAADMIRRIDTVGKWRRQTANLFV